MRNTSLRGGTTKQSPAITERPMLFQTEMVKAILEGRKTQTRRTKGLEVPKDLVFDEIKFYYRSWPKRPLCFMKSIIAKGKEYFQIIAQFKCPYGKPGDLLWVKETWSKVTDASKKEDNRIHFKASTGKNNFTWKPSIHMPKEASRIWLMIEDIRVERVQEISERDAIAEGIEEISKKYGYEFDIYKDYMGFMHDGYQTPRYSFKSLWVSINGEESWNANPWVWVIQFRVLSTTGKPSDEVIQKNLRDLSASAVNQEKEVTNG